jgi:hypothetical protein
MRLRATGWSAGLAVRLLASEHARGAAASPVSNRPRPRSQSSRQPARPAPESSKGAPKEAPKEAPKSADEDLKTEEREANPYSETVNLKLTVTPQVKAQVTWGAKQVARLGARQHGHRDQPPARQRARRSGDQGRRFHALPHAALCRSQRQDQCSPLSPRRGARAVWLQAFGGEETRQWRRRRRHPRRSSRRAVSLVRRLLCTVNVLVRRTSCNTTSQMPVRFSPRPVRFSPCDAEIGHGAGVKGGHP